MKISCLQENLSRGLAVVGRAVASRATLPVTQNVLLSVDQSMLKLSATNLEIAMTTWVGAMIEEEGSIEEKSPTEESKKDYQKEIDEASNATLIRRSKQRDRGQGGIGR